MDNFENEQSKVSYSLNYEGCEIWCEHLDSLGKHTNLLMDKLERDLTKISLPDSASSIIMIFDDSEIDKSLLTYIFRKIDKTGKKIRKIGIMGLPRKLVNEVPSLSITSDYPIKCFSDFDKAKQWVI